MQSSSGGGFGEFIRMVREAIDEAMDPSLGSPTGERAPRRERPQRRGVTTVDVDAVPREVEEWHESEHRRDEQARERRAERARPVPVRRRAIRAESLRVELRQRDAVRRAVVLTEILGQPRGLERGNQRRPGGW